MVTLHILWFAPFITNSMLLAMAQNFPMISLSPIYEFLFFTCMIVTQATITAIIAGIS